MNCLIQSEYVGGFWRCWGCGVIGFQGSDTTTPAGPWPNARGHWPCVRGIRGAPRWKNTCLFGHCPNSDWIPHFLLFFWHFVACVFSQKIRKFLKQWFWLWELWEWIFGKYSDGNVRKYWWNVMKIWCLRNGLYSLENCHCVLNIRYEPVTLSVSEWVSEWVAGST